jgi:hypothetical protein
MPAGKKVAKRIGVGCLLLVVVAFLAIFLTPAGKAFRDVLGTGVLQANLSAKEMETYHASETGNLKAIYNALKLYQDSEGQFPDSKTWMDAIKNRMLADNMTGEEAAKKLVSPSLRANPGQYGYAMNDAASGKYIGDLDPKMPLIFDSSDVSRNAHGSPAKLLPKPPRGGQNMAISADGTILKL